MDASSWERLQRIFHDALQLEPHRRLAYLEEACRGDAALRQQLERMVAVSAGDSFVREPIDRAHDAVESATGGSEPPAFPDEVVFPSGRYRVCRPIGAGGMGQVCEAVDVDRGTRVAIKSLARLNPTAIYRFKQEFRRSAHVSHPNLVTLHEFTSLGDQWFLSMEYVEGVDFLEHVRHGPKQACDVDRLRAALAQLVAGTQCLHEHGILHRDLKPSNVLVTPDARVVVLDFGLVTDLTRGDDTAPSSGAFVGTVRYMSPEQSCGAALTAASDWYSVGVMVYEALTGQPPFRGTAADVLRDKGTMDPPAPTTLVAGVPSDLNDLCMAWLSRDPTSRPAAPAWLGAAASTAGRSTHPEPAARSALVGRTAHQLALRDAFSAAGGETPRVALIHGPSGIGKSALVSWFVADVVQAPNVLVLEGRCFERESVAFKVFDSVIDALSAHLRRLPRAECASLLPPAIATLARVFPVLRTVPTVTEDPRSPVSVTDQGAQRHDAFEALRDLLTRMSRRWRLVLAVDDLHWADVDSAALLHAILRPPGAPPLLFVGSYRSGAEHEEATSFLREFLQGGPDGRPAIGHDIPVGPLSREELVSLAAVAAPGLSTDAQAVLAEESAGNPYFMVELISINSDDATRPTTLDGILSQRSERLPVAAQRLLATVAVAGHPIDERDACHAAGVTNDAVASLALLRAQRLVRGSTRRSTRQVGCWHDRVREAVASRLTDDERRHHHASLAATFVASGTEDPECIAGHLEGAGQLEAAGRQFATAASVALNALAFDHATELYTKALALGAFAGDERHHLLAGRAEALDYAGRGPEAARAYEEAARHLDEASLSVDVSTRLGEYERRAAYWYMNSGHSTEGRRVFATMLERVGLAMPATPARALLALATSELRLRLRGLGFAVRAAADIPHLELDRIDITKDAAGCIITADVVAGAYFNTRSLLLALDAGEPNRIAYMLMLQVVSASIVGPRMRARREKYRTAAASLESRVDDPVVRASFRWGDGAVRFFLGQFSAAVTDLEAGLLILRRDCKGQTREAAQADFILQVARLHLGDCREVLEAMEDATERAQQRGDRFLAAASAVFHAEAALLLGQLPMAARSLERAVACLTEPRFHTVHARLALGRARLALVQGDAERARSLLDAEWPRLRRHFFLRSENFWQWSYFTRASICLACAVGSKRAAMVTAAEADARHLEGDSLTWSRSLALLIRAGCAGRRGSTEQAAACLQAAGQTTEMPLVAAAARFRLGALMGGAQGRSEVDAALAVMEANGIRDCAHLTAAFVPVPD